VPEALKDAVDILKRKSEINGGKGEWYNVYDLYRPWTWG
jgi:hypothetical protein